MKNTNFWSYCTEIPLNIFDNKDNFTCYSENKTKLDGKTSIQEGKVFETSVEICNIRTHNSLLPDGPDLHHHPEVERDGGRNTEDAQAVPKGNLKRKAVPHKKSFYLFFKSYLYFHFDFVTSSASINRSVREFSEDTIWEEATVHGKKSIDSGTDNGIHPTSSCDPLSENWK